MKRLTFQDRIEIEKCIKQKMNTKKISSFLKIPYSTIRDELRRCNGYEFYNAKESQEQIDKIWKSAYNRISCKLKSKNVMDILKLKDMIKEISNYLDAFDNVSSSENELRVKVEHEKDENEYFNSLSQLQDLSNRIYNLEQQVEILFENIVEKK